MTIAKQFIEKHTLKVLLFVVLVGLAVRVVQIDTLPKILNRDEAALAYNAYLLKETGQDEWGKSWPLALESFGDFKLPGYVWLLVGTFSLFGLSDGVVRLPAVVAGTALIPLSYFLSRQLRFSQRQALGLAIIVCFSPIFILRMYSTLSLDSYLLFREKNILARISLFNSFNSLGSSFPRVLSICCPPLFGIAGSNETIDLLKTS